MKQRDPLKSSRSLRARLVFSLIALVPATPSSAARRWIRRPSVGSVDARVVDGAVNRPARLDANPENSTADSGAGEAGRRIAFVTSEKFTGGLRGHARRVGPALQGHREERGARGRMGHLALEQRIFGDRSPRAGRPSRMVRPPRQAPWRPKVRPPGGGIEILTRQPRSPSRQRATSGRARSRTVGRRHLTASDGRRRTRPQRFVGRNSRWWRSHDEPSRRRACDENNRLYCFEK